MQGTIFDIQRFSVHDGPGIRTTVFCKGCPLRCQWCHNPEGLHAHIQLQYRKELCIGCGLCGKRETEADAKRCPSGALTVCGRRVTPLELLREVMKDLPFYGAEGGLTLSGGECLLQADFAAEVLRLAKNEGISTAVDTCGYVPWESIEKVLNVCDLFLYDIKMMDREKHKLYTGVYPELIHENLIRLSNINKPVWIRVPVIPGVNDSEQEILRIAQLLRPLRNIKSITLIPYHTLGKSKYETLGLACAYNTSEHITPARIEQLENLLMEAIRNDRTHRVFERADPFRRK